MIDKDALIATLRCDESPTLTYPEIKTIATCSETDFEALLATLRAPARELPRLSATMAAPSPFEVGE